MLITCRTLCERRPVDIYIYIYIYIYFVFSCLHPNFHRGTYDGVLVSLFLEFLFCFGDYWILVGFFVALFNVDAM